MSGGFSWQKGFIENHKKNKFSGFWRIVRALGPDGPWVVDFYLIPEFLAKVFEKMRFRADGPRGPGGRTMRCRGRSVIRYRTGCCSVDRADGPRPPADSPRGPDGRSVWPWRTVGPAQRAVSPVVDFAFLPLEFKRGQSARASRTVREARVLSLTASNGKGEYLYSKPGVGVSLLAL
jgi:hypothetical protein